VRCVVGGTQVRHLSLKFEEFYRIMAVILMRGTDHRGCGRRVGDGRGDIGREGEVKSGKIGGVGVHRGD
jgi:hypothetical protein